MGTAEYGAMRVGTSEHRDLFCGTFITGHRAYEPEDLAWPELEPKYLERLKAIPFWAIARAMERKAGVMVAAYAQTLGDPVIREAVALQGVEEARHARLISHMIDRYGLDVEDLWVKQPDPVTDDFVVFGYEECLDFFMGSAVFGLAGRMDFLPAAFVQIFDEVLFEEARHVTFFINWFRYEEARAGRDHAFGRHVTAIKNYVRSIKQLVTSFSGVETTGFAAVGANAMIEGMTPKMFLEAALTENRRYLGKLDSRLIKPSLLPALSTVLLTVLRALPPVPSASAAQAAHVPDGGLGISPRDQRSAA